MAKSNLEATHWASPEKIQARAKLRAVANAVAKQSGSDVTGVLELLVTAQIRAQCADIPGAIPSWVKFEMGSHNSDMVRHAVHDIISLFAEPDDPTDEIPDDPVLRERREMLRLSSARYLRDHPWPPTSQ